MVLGYSRERPTKDDYSVFMERLVEGFKRLNVSGLSFMVYGSFVRGDMDIGRSDVDGLIIFDDNVVINKLDLLNCSGVLSEALGDTNVPFQVTVTDRTTMKDGRFNSYNPTFAGYFNEEGKLLVGPDYRSEFTFTMPEHPEQGPLTFNLRKSRQGLFFSEHDALTDYELFLTRFNKSLDAVSRGSKQILHMVDGRLTKNRFSALERLSGFFPSIDIAPLARIKELYRNPERLDNVYQQRDAVMGVWTNSVTFLEKLIKGYIERFPITD